MHGDIARTKEERRIQSDFASACLLVALSDHTTTSPSFTPTTHAPPAYTPLPPQHHSEDDAARHTSKTQSSKRPRLDPYPLRILLGLLGMMGATTTATAPRRLHPTRTQITTLQAPVSMGTEGFNGDENE